MLQRGQRFAEDFQKAALHGQQRLLLRFLPLATFRLLGRRLRGPLSPGEGCLGERLAVFSLLVKKKKKLEFCIVKCFFLLQVKAGTGSDLEVVVKHLLAVQEVGAGLAQVTQVNLQHKTSVGLAALRWLPLSAEAQLLFFLFALGLA